MTHEDEGNYRAKHGSGPLNEKITGAVREKSTDNAITCARAHAIASELGVDPMDVGVAIDRLEIKIKNCQLGFFSKGRDRVDIPGEEIDPGLVKAIEAALTDGRLTCLSAWDLAEQYGKSRIFIARVCEKIGIKISRCQLGTFK